MDKIIEKAVQVFRDLVERSKNDATAVVELSAKVEGLNVALAFLKGDATLVMGGIGYPVSENSLFQFSVLDETEKILLAAARNDRMVNLRTYQSRATA